MTTVAQLAAQPYQEFGYVLFVEGWRVAWTNRVELAGSGVSSWIGTGRAAPRASRLPRAPSRRRCGAACGARPAEASRAATRR